MTVVEQDAFQAIVGKNDDFTFPKTRRDRCDLHE